jgi:transcriptional regulator CtsR
MSTYAELIAEDARLIILQALEQDVGYSHNEGVLQAALRSMGHSLSRDQVRTQLQWLADQSLISIEQGAHLMIATITATGADVATGAARVPGVRRPRPGA